MKTSTKLASTLPPLEEFGQTVSTVNIAMANIGLPGIRIEDTLVTMRGSVCSYLPLEGLIQVTTDTAANKGKIGHEKYHQYSMESALTPEELSVLNRLRSGMTAKIRGEIVARHGQVVDYLRGNKVRGERLQNFFPYIANSLDEVLEGNYLFPIPVPTNTMFLWMPTEDKRFPALVFPEAGFVAQAGSWVKVPHARRVVFDYFKHDILSEEEKLLIGRLNYSDEALASFHPEIAAIAANSISADPEVVRVIDKFAARMEMLVGVGEAPAYLVGAWLSGKDMDNYQELRKYVAEGTYASSGFGKGNGREERLSELVVGNFQKLRESGVSLEDAIAQTVNIRNFLGIVSPSTQN
ncbi:hypothetical protein HYY73_02865 [Candidatus Woesearchaeota archaeon]|nr:hypothetical protein [Candidatus Woesearchaeota archaeon]